MATTTNPTRRQRPTRRPNGNAPWPMILLAGNEKCGKTYAIFEASKSPLIGRTLYIPFGEDPGDDYKEVAGPNLEIVPNDGSYSDLLDAVQWAVTEPRGADGKPTLVALDSVTRLWDMLVDEQHVIAQRRAERKAAQQGKTVDPDAEVPVTMEQWNIAKTRFARVVAALRTNPGPVLLTARLEEVTVVVGGKPTTQKEWKVKAEKNLVYAVTGTVQMREYRKAIITGMKSPRLGVGPDDDRRFPNFTVHGLWTAMGLTDTAQFEQVTSGEPNPEAGADELEAKAAEAERGVTEVDPQIVAFEINEASQGANPVEALRKLGNHYGAQVLAGVPFDRRNGERVTAAAQIRSLIEWHQQHAQGAPAPAQDEDQTRAQEEPPTAQEPPSEEEPVRAHEEDERAQSARAAAQAAVDKTTGRRSKADDLLRTHLASEAQGQAATLGVTVEEHLAPVTPGEGGLRAIPTLKLRRYVLSKRADVVEALAQAGNATMAQVYGQVSQGQTGPWDILTGTRVLDGQEAVEPAPAQQ